MKLGLINSAWAQAGQDTARGIRMTKELGFDTIDIFADPLDMSAREQFLVKARVRPGGPSHYQFGMRRRWPDRLQPLGAALSPRALPGISRSRLSI